jgi:hypothetical protein
MTGPERAAALERLRAVLTDVRRLIDLVPTVLPVIETDDRCPPVSDWERRAVVDEVMERIIAPAADWEAFAAAFPEIHSELTILCRAIDSLHWRWLGEDEAVAEEREREYARAEEAEARGVGNVRARISMYPERMISRVELTWLRQSTGLLEEKLKAEPPGPPPPWKRVRIDKSKNNIIFDNIEYKSDTECVLFVGALIQHEHEYFAANKIRGLEAEKPGRLRNRLPEPLRAQVELKPGAGCRFKPPRE